MDKAIEIITSWIQRNFKNPKLYAIFAAVIVVIALIFPYVDANFFYYSRVEKRIDILQSLSEIDMEKVSRHPALQEEYDAIISEIEKQRDLSISSAVAIEQATSNIPLFKFLSGGALAWIVTLCVPFMNTFKDKKSKVLAFFLFALLGGILGGIAYIIPTIFNPWINYIGYPSLQLIILVALAIAPKQG